MSDETYYVDQWLYQTLASDATLTGLVGTRFFSDEATSEGFPYVMWTFLSGVDVFGQGPFRIMLNCLYTVKIVGKTRSYGDVKPGADRIDTLINAKGGDTLAGDHIFSCVREEAFRQSELSSGVSYRHLGGIYRILVQKG